MMKKFHWIHLLCTAGLLTGLWACSAPNMKITVKNPSDRNRSHEMVEIPAEQVRRLAPEKDVQLVLRNEAGQEIPYQLVYNGNLIFQADVKASSETGYLLQVGEPTIAVSPSVFGKQFPERVDDMAWENNRCAYRTYGPALQKSGERAFGYDVWTKSTEALVVEKRYAMDLDKASHRQMAEWRKQGERKKADSLWKAISYHYDHGDGMDCYKVGPTLGAGTNALMEADSILYPYCYSDYEILDNGPLRFTVRLTYLPFDTGDSGQVVETRILSLDKDSYLNKAVIRYDGLKAGRKLAVGIVIHPENQKVMGYDPKAGYMYYLDQTDRIKAGNGKIYIGAVFPEAPEDIRPQWFGPEERKQRGGASGHLLSITDYRPETDYVYYWGSAWSKSSMKTLKMWTTYLRTYSLNLNQPLQVSCGPVKKIKQP